MFCHNCGKEIDSTATFCPYCGKATPQKETAGNSSFGSQSDPSYVVVERKGKPWILIGIVAVIAIIIVIVLNNVHTPVSDMKSMVFDSFGSEEIGDVLDGALNGVHWDSTKTGDYTYTVWATGYFMDLYSEITIYFNLSYPPDSDVCYGNFDGLEVDGEHYDDIVSAAIIIESLYAS